MHLFLTGLRSEPLLQQQGVSLGVQRAGPHWLAVPDKTMTIDLRLQSELDSKSLRHTCTAPRWCSSGAWSRWLASPGVLLWPSLGGNIHLYWEIFTLDITTEEFDTLCTQRVCSGGWQVCVL